MVDTTSSRPVRRVVVAGDVTLDWNLAREPVAGDSPPASAPVSPPASWQRGGAALLTDLLSAVAADLAAEDLRVEVEGPPAPTDPVAPGDHHTNHSYALWGQVPRTTGVRADGHAWRSECFLGVDRAPLPTSVDAGWEHLTAALPRADVVVLDDAALGFRERSEIASWQRGLAVRRPWVVLKQAGPVASGPLWEHLLATTPERLVVVLTIDDLRGREVQVSHDLSWERTAQDLLWELVHKPAVAALSTVAHTIVSFGPAGAALASASADGHAAPTCALYFDSRSVEGTWGLAHPGQVMGTTDTLTAAVVRELLLAPDSPDLGHAIQVGTAAERTLHLTGYEVCGEGRMELAFPYAAVVTELGADQAPLHTVAVTDPARSDHYWTILEERCTGDLAATAAEITVHGAEAALVGVPLGRFGHLLTADRSEIEAFRTVGGLIGEYVRRPQSKPLSLGVFGPPGSGKSFGVKEVARAVGRDVMDAPLEFNLAQLSGPADLADAFHLVRDRALTGAVPLVFWDEFDTVLDGRPLGWLRYFLAPMQDGEFRQGQISHPLGRSIFVFAGGTSSRMEDFVERVEHDDGRLAKGPDFVSRLKGFVDILGPNPQGPADPYHLVRRAILLRSMLERTAGQLFSGDELRIDRGVLRALLQTREYRHGARSLEAILSTSRLAGKSAYERSSLPSESQLDLHVDAEDFLGLVQQPDLEGDLLDRLARAAHAVYCAGLEGRSDLTPEEKGSLLPYDELAAYKKEENLRTVRDIPAKLALVGCVIMPGRADLAQAVLTDKEIWTLARDEHRRWLQGLGPGWRYGNPTDKDRRVHVDYRPWDELPEADREKDAGMIREIPAILARAGYVVVRTGAGRGG